VVQSTGWHACSDREDTSGSGSGPRFMEFKRKLDISMLLRPHVTIRRGFMSSHESKNSVLTSRLLILLGKSCVELHLKSLRALIDNQGSILSGHHHLVRSACQLKKFMHSMVVVVGFPWTWCKIYACPVLLPLIIFGCKYIHISYSSFSNIRQSTHNYLVASSQCSLPRRISAS